MANDRQFIGSGYASQSYELINPLDLYLDEEYRKAVRTVPYMSALSWLKAIKGRHSKRKVRRHEYSYWEEGQFMNANATIAAIAANGAKFDITLSAGDHNDLGGTDESSFPVKGMSVLFQDGSTTGYVESVDRDTAGAHVITVKKWNPDQDIASVALVGTTMMFYSNAQPERSGKTESRVEQFEKVTNKMQIIREYFDSTDVEMQNALRFTTSSGKEYLWYKGIESTMQRFEFQKEAALLLTPQASGLTDASGKPVGSAFGMIPQIEQHGINLEYFNTPDKAGFDEVTLALDNNFAEKSYLALHGMNVMIKLTDWLVQFGQNGTGNISFSPFDGGSEQAIKLNFKSYSIGAYEFYFQQLGLFSHKSTLGAPNLPFRHKVIFVPAGNVRNPDPDKPAGSPEYEPYMQLVSPIWGRATNSNIDKGEYLMFETGALASQGPTSDILEAGVHMVAYESLEMRCRHMFAQWDLA